MDILDLPIVVNGRRVHSAPESHVFRYSDDFAIRIPKLQEKDLQEMEAASNEAIADLHVDDITIFLNELGQRWLDDDYHFRAMARTCATRTTEYVGPSIYYDLGLLSTAMRRIKLYDMLETDLGDPYLLEEWKPSKTVYLRAQPRGKALHVLVGNIPMAGLFSILRSVLTKNCTVAKLPSRDVATSLLFALSFLDLDPEHPVSRSLSAVYWEPGSPEEERMLAAADVVCAWGSAESIEAIKRRTPYGVELVEFGPKRSLHLIGAVGPDDLDDLDDLAMRAAYDVSIYDQQACFSPQEAFVEGDADAYAERLGAWLDRNLARVPKPSVSVDERALVSRTRKEATFRGWRVLGPEDGGTGWTLIVTDGPQALAEHPLRRTLFLHPVRELREALPFIDKHTQTVGIYPADRALELGRAVVARGADRITEVGRTGRPRPGMTHDGMRAMDRLVRWVTIERGIRFKYKFWGLSPAEDERLFYGRGQEAGAEDPMEVWRAYEEVNLR